MDPVGVLTHSFWGYIQELFVPIGIGFLLSGIINEFMPGNIIQKYLGENSLKSILTATFVGTLLPVCCVGSLPIAVTLRSKGAKLGPVLAFLVTTPATSASAIFATWKMMGLTYAAYMCVTVILMGIAMGIAAGARDVPETGHRPEPENSDCCAPDAKKPKSIPDRLSDSVVYAFYDLPKRMGLEIVIGIVVASLIISFEGIRNFLNVQLSGFKGYVILIFIGLLDYVCSTASVPVANAISASGVSAGKSMVYLLMGPITSFATLVVIRKEYGNRILALYLCVIALGSLAAGVSYDFFFPGGKFMG